MKTKLIALLMIFALMFTLCACKAADDEEEAASGGGIVNSSDDDGNSDGSGSDDDSAQDDSAQDNNNSDDSSSYGNTTDGGSSDDTTSDGGSSDDDKEENTPPLSGEGKYTVTFDYGYNDKAETEKTDGKVTEVTPSRAGYNFKGWYKGSDKWDFSKSVSSSMTLKAKWEIITYTITYNANGATIPSENPTSYTVENSIALKPAVMAGKAFYGWEIKSDKESYTADTIAKGTIGNLTLTPVWDDTVVVLGKYEKDGNTENGEEDIVWVKIKEEGGKALLITKEIIDAKQFDSNSGPSIKWMNCGLRNWLNKTFYSSAFTSEEKAAIIETTVTSVGQFDGSTSKDRVFILSMEEAAEYMSSYFARRANVTPYAEANGAQVSSSGGWWWLRNKISDYGAALIENDGNIRSIGYTGKMTTIGVRPCIWVDMSKLG